MHDHHIQTKKSSSSSSHKGDEGAAVPHNALHGGMASCRAGSLYQQALHTAALNPETAPADRSCSGFDHSACSHSAFTSHIPARQGPNSRVAVPEESKHPVHGCPPRCAPIIPRGSQDSGTSSPPAAPPSVRSFHSCGLGNMSMQPHACGHRCSVRNQPILSNDGTMK